MKRQSRQSRLSSFAPLVILVGTLAVWSIPGAAARDAAPTLDANGQSENGMQPDLRGWLKPYTQPRLFVTA